MNKGTHKDGRDLPTLFRRNVRVTSDLSFSKNHNPAFWKLLRSVFRQTDECKAWLERNSEVWEMGV